MASLIRPNLCSGFDRDAFFQDIERFLENQGWTKGFLADAAGISRGTIYNTFISRKLGIDTAAALAFVCDLSLDTYVKEAA
jgi:hypothetical protein